MSKIVDLDALAPPEVTIKFAGQTIQIKPPTTQQVFKLGFLGQKMQDGQKLSDAEVTETVAGITELIKECIPELEVEKLSTKQLLKVISILNDMSTPEDTKELNERGIQVGDPKAP